MLKPVFAILFFFATSLIAAGQSASGVTPPPGTQNRNSSTQPCADIGPVGTPPTQAAVDANCASLSPNFAEPSANIPKEVARPVTAIIRVGRLVEKPVASPFPADFSVVGDATMVKAKLPRLQACLAVGRGWSRRTQSSTSTTCVDRKGEVLAYQECKSGADVPACTVTTPQPGDALAVTAAPMRP